MTDRKEFYVIQETTGVTEVDGPYTRQEAYKHAKGFDWWEIVRRHDDSKTTYDGLYFTLRGGCGFVRLTGNKVKVYPVFFDARSTFERWREESVRIPFRFLDTIEGPPQHEYD